MKKLISPFLILITSVSFAQINPAIVPQTLNIEIDTTSFVKPDATEPVLDVSVTNGLEPFKDQNDAVIYIYRMKSLVGKAVKWQIEVDSITVGKIAIKEYIVVHINTAQKSHIITYPNLKYNYVNFKPNKYYFVRFRGFTLNTGYLDANSLDDLKSCKISKPLKK